MQPQSLNLSLTFYSLISFKKFVMLLCASLSANKNLCHKSSFCGEVAKQYKLILYLRDQKYHCFFYNLKQTVEPQF
jgi:hypothetical protein